MFNADEDDNMISRCGKATPEKAEHEEVTERKMTALFNILMIGFTGGDELYFPFLLSYDSLMSRVRHANRMSPKIDGRKARAWWQHLLRENLIEHKLAVKPVEIFASITNILLEWLSRFRNLVMPCASNNDARLEGLFHQIYICMYHTFHYSMPALSTEVHAPSFQKLIQLVACTKDYHTVNSKVGGDLRLLTGLYLIPRTSQTVWRPVHIIGECNVIVWLEWSQLDQLVHFYGPTWAKYSLRNGRRRCH